MKISYNWLKEYINIDIPHLEVAKILTSIGLEVEHIEEYQSIKGGLQGLVVGEVVTCAKHPDADKLSVTTVNIGAAKLLDIVCGAPNVAAGQKVIVATVGTTLYNNEEPWTIKKSKIRGSNSEGMICAEDEIGVGNSHDGIIVLPTDTKIGTSAKDYFNVYTDIIFEIGLTPNRIDAASHYGVARDLFAFLKTNGHKNVALNYPKTDNFKIDNTDNCIDVIVENTEACPRYAGITISNVQIKESPAWLKNKLNAIGQKSINNVVDITNYILHEIGHPLHAFDADKITGKKVIVKNLADNTLFRTLDNQERKLSNLDLMICNQTEGMCIGGIFGGIDSGVSEKTTNIFLECAYFNPVFIRKTAKRHGLSTDSSFRFERGVDANDTVNTLKRAAMLIKEVANGQISSDIIDVAARIFEPCKINLEYKEVDRLIGKKIGQEKIKLIVKSLEINILEETNEALLLEIPTYRVDVTRPADVIEDILRIYGYNNVETPENVNSSLSYTQGVDRDKLKNTLSDMLSHNGFAETISNSLTRHSYFQNLDAFKEENTVKIKNPISQDLNVMRQTLLFCGLETIERNIKFKNNDIKIYEFGNIYKYYEEKTELKQKYFETLNLAVFVTGMQNAHNWNTPATPSDFFFLKSHCENVFKHLGFDIETFVTDDYTADIYNYAIAYKINNKIYATCGSVKNNLLKNHDINQEVFFADIQWQELINILPKPKKYKAISNFPEVKRDLALLLDEKIKFQQIKDLAFKTERNYLKKVSIFDLYKGEKIGAGKKSYAVTFVLQDENKTFTDTQIDKIMNRFMEVYKKELNASIR